MTHAQLFQSALHDTCIGKRDGARSGCKTCGGSGLACGNCCDDMGCPAPVDGEGCAKKETGCETCPACQPAYEKWDAKAKGYLAHEVAEKFTRKVQMDNTYPVRHVPFVRCSCGREVHSLSWNNHLIANDIDYTNPVDIRAALEDVGEWESFVDSLREKYTSYKIADILTSPIPFTEAGTAHLRRLG